MITTQVFWDLNLDVVINEINGVKINPMDIPAFIKAYPNFYILQDDTDVDVLMVDTEDDQVDLTYDLRYHSISVIAEFWGERPHREI